MRINRKTALLGAFLFAVVALIIFVALIIHSANSLNIEVWWVEIESEEKFLAKITLGIVNNGVFPVILKDAKLKTTLNEIDMSPIALEEEFFMVGLGWKRITITYSLSEDYSEILKKSDKYNVNVLLDGDAICIFYTNPLEIENKKTW